MTETMADSRDMYAVHNAFRREFAALPELVRGVADGDTARAALVTGHATLVFDTLHVHHTGEDRVVWPLLLARTPDRLHDLIETMEAQHAGLDQLLTTARQRLATWQTTPGAGQREEAATTLDALVPALTEHLTLEEREVMPLIDEHLTAQEWASTIEEGRGLVAPRNLPIVFGMMLAEAAPEQRALIKASTPAPVFAIMSRLGPWTYRRHQRRVHGH